MTVLARSMTGVLGVGSLRLWHLKSLRCSFMARPIQSQRLSIRCSSSCTKTTEIEFDRISAAVVFEGSKSVTPELELVVKQLQEDAPKAVKLAVRDHEAAKLADATELSVVISDDKYIRKLNKKWLGKDSPTDVLSFPQNQPPGEAPLLLLGDVVISVETAAKQAKERKHSLLDELRILLVHGLLHLLGHDHELGPEASEKMEQEEKFLLKSLGWKGKGLINSSDKSSSTKTPVSRPNKKSPFRILFCDMDGTLLNTKGRISKTTADAVKAAVAAGVQVIVATGKTRGGSIAALKDVGLSGEGGIVSTSHPGVFVQVIYCIHDSVFCKPSDIGELTTVQGLLVYGLGGSVVHQEVLPKDYCVEAFNYGLRHEVAVCGFCGDRIVAPFDHQFFDYLHEHFLEPKAEILSSLEDLEKQKIQKILFGVEQARIDKTLRPHFRAFTKGQATLVQACKDMLEILPAGATKGDGVRRLLEKLDVDPDEVMAIGDGENDIEMLKMVGWGVAMGNAVPYTLDIADATVTTNDEDGVAEAIERFILP